MAVTVANLAKALDARAWGDLGQAVTGVAEPAQAGPGVVALAMAPQYAKALRPGAIAILAEGMNPEDYGLSAAIFATRPRLLMAGLTRAFDPGPALAPGVHPTAVIDPAVEIGAGAAIGPFVVIGPDVRIGAGARIAAHVSIGAGTRIGADALILDGVRIGQKVRVGDRLIAQPGAVIGSDGFSLSRPRNPASKRFANRWATAMKFVSSTGPAFTALAALKSAMMSKSVPIPPSIRAPSAQPASGRAPRSIILSISAIMSWWGAIACSAVRSGLPAVPGSGTGWFWPGNAASLTISKSAMT